MLTLDVDIQYMILDYIQTREDLKALCLASRGLHEHVMPRLYERIDLRIWSRSDTDRFMASVAAGAGENFRHAKTLVIQDKPLVAEPVCDVTELRLLNHYDWEDPLSLAEAVRDDHLSTVLNLLPQHCLRRFSFVSRRCLPSSIVKHLQIQQNAIKELYCTSSPELSILFGNLRQLHIYLLDPAHLAHYLQHPHTFGEHIQHLSLIHDNPGHELELPVGVEPTKILPKLEGLTLTHMNIKYCLRDAFLHMLDTPNLTHFSMLGCWGDNNYTTDLGAVAQGTGVKLEHLALSLHWLSEDKSGTVETYLGDLLNASKYMKSLHVQWYNPLPSPQSLVNKICTIGPRLELLSLHQEMYCQIAAPLSSEDFQAICKSCPNLRQIGIQFFEETYYDDDPYGELENFIASIKLLQDLQMVHVRLSGYFKVGLSTDDGEPNPNIITMQVQMVANKIFGELNRDRSCPKLDAIVFGHMVAFDRHRDDQGWGALPQFCFVKAEQRDRLGRVTAVGVPVSRVLLRRTQPYTDVLDLDPATDSWDRWAWQAIV